MRNLQGRKRKIYLVHEHVEGKKLSDVLGELSWESRKKIAIGIVKALRYLHGCCSLIGIVGNVSPHNVMVVEGKDEALIKLILPWVASPDITKRLVSSAYVAPETKETKELIDSSDMYGFGLILIELVTGKTPADAEIGLHENLVDWARYCYSDCHFETWVDPLLNVHASKNLNQIVEIMNLALQCTACDPATRPYAWEVVKTLESIRRSAALVSWHETQKACHHSTHVAHGICCMESAVDTYWNANGLMIGELVGLLKCNWATAL
ncbi:hypothetical protein L1987_84432 [Smallanthus sonchifolius]|uniref:Uncharacterized protein n=1 Tax=Smallanthus sonchifolius TaxID=185202 RepID=A0ACB8YFC9_9ASTR|nr:hypothetical protein L1987_84432 [Smallanthus sonchifolius]